MGILNRWSYSWTSVRFVVKSFMLILYIVGQSFFSTEFPLASQFLLTSSGRHYRIDNTKTTHNNNGIYFLGVTRRYS